MRRKEVFIITKFARRYDQESKKFVISIAYKTKTDITDRTIEVAEAFGLGIDEFQKHVVYDNVELKIGPTDIVYITGDSGSGKSVLLRRIQKDLGAECIDLRNMKIDRRKPLVDTLGNSTQEALELLSRVGLNDAFLFVRRFSQLSDGQKYRYRIAKLIESGKQYWIMDEFCATLDRDTAKIVAFNVQKLARKLGRAVFAATTHTDLFEDLQPSVHIHKSFGREIKVNYYPNQMVKECSLIKEIHIEEGTLADYKELASFHYRSQGIAAPRKIFCLKRGNELCGVIVYCYPPIACFGRRSVLPKMSIRELNEKLSTISRVVMHPKYRTIGLGQRLVHETLQHAGTPFVEMIAVMAKYNPFAERAGMTKIAEQDPPKESVRLAEAFSNLGFSVTFLSSKTYVLKKLRNLKSQDLKKIRQAFKDNKHPRFMKQFFYHQPYGRGKLFNELIDKAEFEKLAKLTKIVGLLLQIKVYLFWSARVRRIMHAPVTSFARLCFSVLEDEVLRVLVFCLCSLGRIFQR